MLQSQKHGARHVFFSFLRMGRTGLCLSDVGKRVYQLFGRSDDPQERGRNRRWALAAGLVINIAILGTFKYLGFFCGILADMGLTLAVPKIALPDRNRFLYVSVDILSGGCLPQGVSRAASFCGFVTLYLYVPQLIVGPIVRYGTVADEINDRHVSASDFRRFLSLFIGLGKKVILAKPIV